MWLASEALGLGLVDGLMTSDAFLLAARDEARLFEIAPLSAGAWPSSFLAGSAGGAGGARKCRGAACREAGLGGLAMTAATLV